MDGVTLEQCQRWLEQLRGKRLAVVGDLMLDHYFVGSVQRISPEAPVPVVEWEEERFRLGGAVNVAQNLRLLGAEVLLCGCIGADEAGNRLHELAHSLGIDVGGVMVDSQRPTTIKTRIIGNNQQLLRLDREQRAPINDTLAQALLSRLRDGNIEAVILEDYNKGVLTTTLIPELIEWAQKGSVPVFVDPKLENFFAYRGATLVKPNQKETQHAVGFSLDGEDAIVHAGKVLLERLQTQHVLITLGSHGMMLIERAGTHWHIPSMARHVADVSGAGDTVIATLAAMVVAGASVRQAALAANIAAGVVCGEPGVVPITAGMLLQAITTITVPDGSASPLEATITTR